MSPLAAKWLFGPTLLWNILWARVLRRWNWWDAIDEGLWLGALPLRSDVARLHALGVRAVINLCAETSGPVAAYGALGIEQLHLPTTDFTTPTLDAIERAVAFIAEKKAAREGVYVHCKAGRGRSATVMACWLMHARGVAPAEAQQLLTLKRPQVARNLAGRAVVEAFQRSRLPRAV